MADLQLLWAGCGPVVDRGGHAARRATVLAVFLAFLLTPRLSTAAESPPPSPDLERQAREVERLQSELEKARTELNRLRRENEQLKTAPTPAPPTQPPAAAAAPAPAPPPPPPASLPPLQPDEEVPASELLGQFRANPDAAARRYVDQVFRVAGEADRFEVPLLQRVYDVQLTAPDRLLAVACRFNYVNRYQAVFTQDRGRALVGRIDDRSVRPLLRAGDRVVIRGRCTGIKDGLVVFTGCTLVAREPASTLDR